MDNKYLYKNNLLKFEIKYNNNLLRNKIIKIKTKGLNNNSFSYNKPVTKGKYSNRYKQNIINNFEIILKNNILYKKIKYINCKKIKPNLKKYKNEYLSLLNQVNYNKIALNNLKNDKLFLDNKRIANRIIKIKPVIKTKNIITEMDNYFISNLNKSYN